MNRIRITVITLFLAGMVSVRAGERNQSLQPRATLTVEALKQLDRGLYEVPDSHNLLLTYIPAGTFEMGSPETEIGRQADETRHTVKITRPFYMGITPVTQAQYLNAMHPDHLELCYKKGPWRHTLPTFYKGGPWHVNVAAGPRGALETDWPMDMLSWDEAAAYAQWLTRREAGAGRLPQGYVYRLPTEAEWEYACRAGTQSPFNTQGDTQTFFASEMNSPFGRRKPNAWGLYDMHGGVYEWVQDGYAPYNVDQSTDPQGPATGQERVLRGGCAFSMQEKDGERETTPAERMRFVRSASRHKLPHDYELPITGMRLVLGPRLD
jgi:formylglycine-generating enzyme required for sulfatase activity